MGKILIKTDADYEGATDGYIYRTYDLTECENAVKNDAGFVTSAIVPNEYAVGTAEYRKGNPYDSVTFKKREKETYWAYAEGEHLLSTDGSEIKKAVTTSVAVKPTLVPKTVHSWIV